MWTMRKVLSMTVVGLAVVLLLTPLAQGKGDKKGKAFPATGQTTSYATGDDGDIKAGAALSYTPNANGTITDNNTRLVWEKKTTTCGGDIHCVNDRNTWANAFTGFIATLNTVPCFAGHCD